MMKSHNDSNYRSILQSNTLIIVIAIFITLIVCELLTRVWLHNYASKYEISIYGSVDHIQELQSRYVRHHYLPFIPRPNYTSELNRHNNLGFRGDDFSVPKTSDVFRIVLLGGSTTYTTGVNNYKESYPYLLQENLRSTHHNIEVINAGVPRYSTWESLINLQYRILDIQPDLVIINHGINDVHPRLVYPFEQYKSDNSGSRKVYNSPVDSFLMKSYLIRLISTRLGIRNPSNGLLFIRTHDWLEFNHTKNFQEQYRNFEYPTGIFSDIPVGKMLQKNKPVYFRRNLESMIAIAKVHEIDVVLMTFASSSLFPNHPLASSDEYQSAFKEQNIVIKELCTKHSIICFDLEAAMPEDPIYWRDGRHVSRKGSIMKSRIVSNFLLRSNLLPDD